MQLAPAGVCAVLLELEGCSGRAAQVPEMPTHLRHQVALGSLVVRWNGAPRLHELLHVAVQSGPFQHCPMTLAVHTVSLVLIVHCSNVSANCLLLNARSRSLYSRDASCLRIVPIVHCLSHRNDTRIINKPLHYTLPSHAVIHLLICQTLRA